jgi:hypothetical protein
MGWPECCFADVIDHIRQFVVDKAAHGGTEMLACQLTDGSVIPVIP